MLAFADKVATIGCRAKVNEVAQVFDRNIQLRQMGTQLFDGRALGEVIEILNQTGDRAGEDLSVHVLVALVAVNSRSIYLTAGVRRRTPRQVRFRMLDSIVTRCTVIRLAQNNGCWGYINSRR